MPAAFGNACDLVLPLISLVLVPVAGKAQSPGRVPRIGYLVLSPLVDPPSVERLAFLEGLRDLGYVPGRSLIIEYKSADWNRELLPDLAAELAEKKVDVIVAIPGAVEAARDATRTIPIVVPSITDPVEGGLAASLSRPGGNITGPGGTAWGRHTLSHRAKTQIARNTAAAAAPSAHPHALL